MDDAISKLNAETQGEVLQAFEKAFQREAHNLTPHPDLLWQQLYNRLQWINAPQGDSLETEWE